MDKIQGAFNSLREIGLSGLIDIALMSLFIYALLVFFKRTKAGFVMTGILILSAIYLLARLFNLFLVSFVLQGFFAVILVAVVVIFQEELRHLFEQIAVWSLERNPTHKKRSAPVGRRDIGILVRSLSELARQKIGALVVLRGRDQIVRHLTGGIELGGRLSEPLIWSIFDPHSPGHDGAILVEDGEITRFACHLPLSKDIAQLGPGGTRHAAALGLAELSDALCLVVSEERGTISVARNGELQRLAEVSELTNVLELFYREREPNEKRRPWHDLFKSNYREKAAAVAVTVFLWFVFVHESVVVYRTFEVPVSPSGVSESGSIAEINPDHLRVTFSGPRRSFYFVNKNKIRAPLKLFNVKKGVTKISFAASDILFPHGIDVENIEPDTVRVRLEEKKPEPK